MSSGAKEVKQVVKELKQEPFEKERQAFRQIYEEVHQKISTSTTTVVSGGPVTASPVPPINHDDLQPMRDYLAAEITRLQGQDNQHKKILDLQKHLQFVDDYIAFMEKYEQLGQAESFFEFLEVPDHEFESAEFTFGSGQKHKIDKTQLGSTAASVTLGGEAVAGRWRIGMPLGASSLSLTLASGQCLTVHKDQSMLFSIKVEPGKALNEKDASPFVDMVLANYIAKYEDWQEKGGRGNPPDIGYNNLSPEHFAKTLREYLIGATITRFTLKVEEQPSKFKQMLGRLTHSNPKEQAYYQIIDALRRGSNLSSAEIEQQQLNFLNINPKRLTAAKQQHIDHYHKDSDKKVSNLGRLHQTALARQAIELFLDERGGTPKTVEIANRLRTLFAKLHSNPTGDLHGEPAWTELTTTKGMDEAMIFDALAKRAGHLYQKSSINEDKCKAILSGLGITGQKQAEFITKYSPPNPPPSSPLSP